MMTESPRDRSLRERVTGELAAERMMQKISQQQLAESLGTQKSSISRMESGRQNVSVDYLELIAEKLHRKLSFVLEDPGIIYGDDSQYSLRLYDEELMTFRLTRGLEMSAQILSVRQDRAHLLPPDLKLTPDGLLTWLRHRVIPKNRELVGTILSALNLQIDDLKGIIDICMGLSLNDSYWITQKDFEGTFAEYNLYENSFDEALSLIAYVGHGNSIRRFTTSPELTTGGMLRKAWHRTESDGIWLYKSGTSGAANAGNEPYSEFYACQVAERMGLPCVRYELRNWHHILASRCRLFTDIDTSFVPIGSIMAGGMSGDDGLAGGTSGIEACLEYYRELGEAFYQPLVSMIVFDAVIVNEDRHFGNFGLMRDNRTGRFVSPAPIFDNGMSLLAQAMKADFTEGLDAYIKSRSNPYGRGNGYDELCARLIGPVQKKQLRRLIGFTFTESDLCNLPSWRLRALEEMIQMRVRRLLSLA